MSWVGFWIGTACLFGAGVFVSSQFFLVTDAIAMSFGRILGAYLFAWVVWRAVELKMGHRAPDRQLFVFVLGSLSVGITMMPGIERLWA